MPRTEINYNRTIIYKIVCRDITINDIYIGQTTNYIRRKNEHKNYSEYPLIGLYEKIYNNGGWNNWEMLEIEKFPCKDGNEAKGRQRYWIETLKATLNLKKTILTEEERTNYSKKRKENKIKDATNNIYFIWFDSIYEKTKDKKDIIKLKDIYEEYKSSDYFNNLNKLQKRTDNYKNFIEKIKNNMFLKNFITETPKDKTYIIINYKKIILEN